MSSPAIIGLVAANLGLLFLLLAAPLGVRSVSTSRTIRALRAHVWSALYPLGTNAGWSGDVTGATVLDADESGARIVRLTYSSHGRDDLPIERTVLLDDVEEGAHYRLRVTDDSALDRSFWAGFRETGSLREEGGATILTLERSDSYRGAAFLIFRFFAMRREVAKLKRWAETGHYAKGGMFEHPLTQVGFAVLSAFILWPLFGLSAGGLALAAILTSVVALHELGHMAAFRLMGHRHARMIFIPLLGGIAIGGRPYDSRFEVAFVALMGAGFSAFLVPIAIAASAAAHAAGLHVPATLCAALAGIVAIFNIANLVPIWKFDGGQVLRQICGGPKMLAMASFAILSAFLWLGHGAGVPVGLLLFAGLVVALLSLVTGGGAIKPRHALKPIGVFDRFAIAAALAAIFAIHGYGVLWASARLI